MYFKDQVDEKIDDFWKIHQGENVSFTSNLVLHNNQTWALKVDIITNQSNDIIFQKQSNFQKDLHITLAYRTTSSPAEALKLFSPAAAAGVDNDCNDDHQIWLETQLELSGTIQRSGAWKCK